MYKIVVTSVLTIDAINVNMECSLLSTTDISIIYNMPKASEINEMVKIDMKNVDELLTILKKSRNV